MLGVVFWSSLRFGLKPLALWGICCWHDTPGREMEQLRVLEEGCGDKENYLVWGEMLWSQPYPNTVRVPLCLSGRQKAGV